MFEVRVNDKSIPVHSFIALLGLILFCTNF